MPNLFPDMGVVWRMEPIGIGVPFVCLFHECSGMAPREWLLPVCAFCPPREWLLNLVLLANTGQERAALLLVRGICPHHPASKCPLGPSRACGLRR